VNYSEYPISKKRAVVRMMRRRFPGQPQSAVINHHGVHCARSFRRRWRQKKRR